jgi:hypothetical protein
MSKETKLLITSILVATVTFTIALYFQKIWLALFLALITGVVFMARLVSWSKSDFSTKSSYRFFYGSVFLITLFFGISFAHDYGLKDFQKNILLDIRETIEKGSTRSDIQTKLIYTLSVYHKEERESIVQTFQNLIPDRLSDNGIYLSDHDIREASSTDSDEDDYQNYFYEIDEERDEITFYVISDIPIGDDLNYKNYDGQTGKLEMKFVLNKGGVNYEILN